MFICDMCNRTYAYKRNLSRHITEKHSETKLFQCTEEYCSVTFKRRGYLINHLVATHKLTKHTARTAVLHAKRTGDYVQDYYEDVSSDDEVFDIIEEDLRDSQLDYIQDFNTDLLIETYSNISSPNVNVLPDDNISVMSSCESHTSEVPESDSNADVDSGVSAADEKSDELSVCSSDVSHTRNVVLKSDTEESRYSKDKGSETEESVIVIDSDSEDNDDQMGTGEGTCDEIDMRTLRTEVEVWTRTGYCYTTYSADNVPLFKTSVYSDDYHKYELK